MRKIIYIAIIGVLTLNFLSIEQKEDNNKTSLKMIISMANAQNSESIDHDMTWDDVENWLNHLSSEYGWIDPDDPNNLNARTCATLHGFCDAYDLTGDAVIGVAQYPDGTYYDYVFDECDGQPNAC